MANFKSDDGGMPRKIDLGLPAELTHAISAFGSAARVQILRDLQDRGPASIPAIAARLNLNEHTVRSNLKVMEGTGVLSGDIPPERRTRTAVQYSVNLGRCAELLLIMRTNILLPRDS